VIKIEINNKVEDYNIDEWLKLLFENLAKKAGQMNGYKEGEVSVALVDNQQIKKINKQFRKIDQPTDVLSFPMDEEIWGDVIISIDRAREQAKDYGHSFQREIGYLFTHGVLHLLGYDHKDSVDKKEMRNLEEKILSKVSLPR
jgi:probable rRNA maturation factor